MESKYGGEDADRADLENLNDNFEKFNGGLNYNSRKIELLRNLRHAIRKHQARQLKRVDGPEAEKQMQKGYDWYVNFWNQNERKRLERKQMPPLLRDANGEEETMKSYEQYKQKISEVKFSTFHYFFFRSYADKWKSIHSGGQICQLEGDCINQRKLLSPEDEIIQHKTNKV